MRCSTVDKRNRVNWDTKPSDDIQARYSAAGFANLEVSRQSTDDWYSLLHKMQGAGALPRILDGTLGHLTDNTDFEEDTLFCEWVYWINWEQQTIKVSGGCDPVETTFAELTKEWMLAREVEPESEEHMRNRPQ
jgi:hypothetical protein